MSSFADIIDDNISAPSSAIKAEDTNSVGCLLQTISAFQVPSKETQITTSVHETISSDRVDSTNFKKSRKKVSFSEKDQFYETLYQTPFVNEEDEMIEDTIHVDIESMISGDDLSTSHVSFVTLDKATAGSAFDTESFEDFPLRLSQVESEGPDRFSMDLVIQKLMNLQVSLQPKSGGATPREDTVRGAVYTDASMPSFGSNLEDDDDVLLDLRQVSDENEMMLELVRAASQSLIECFKPKKKPPDDEAESKLRAESLQMLLDDDDNDNDAATESAAVSSTTSNRHTDTSNKPVSSVNNAIDMTKSMLPAIDSNDKIIEFDSGKSKSITQLAESSSSLKVTENVTQHQKEGVQHPNNKTIVSLQDSLIIPIEREEIIQDVCYPNPSSSTSEHTSNGVQSMMTSSSSSKGLVLTGLVASRLSVDNPYSPFSMNISNDPMIDSTGHSPKRYNTTAAPVTFGKDGRDTVEEIKVESSPLTLAEGRSSPKPVECVSNDTHSKGAISITRKSKRSLNNKLEFRSIDDDDSLADRMNYETKQNITVDESALLWLPDGETGTPNKSNASSRRFKGDYDENSIDNSCKESSSATTNPCDSRRPSLNNQLGINDVEPEVPALRVKPSRLIIPPPDSVIVQPITGAQHRRLERLNRHELLAVDLAKGTEGYRKWKLYGNIIFLWLLLPVFFCVLAYGVIPYDKGSKGASNSVSRNATDASPSVYGRDRSLFGVDYSPTSLSSWGASVIPWIFVMTSSSAAAVEIYSSVISEIEFGINIIEDTPCDHLQVIAAAVCSTVAMQFLVFCLIGAGHPRCWLAMIAAGSLSVAFLLRRMFYRSRESAAISYESIAVFRRFLAGLFVLFCVSGIGYTVFTITYAQFAMSKEGFVGYFLAASFPFIRSLLSLIMERCPGIRWGNSKDGLCAGTIAMIVIAMWHGVFLSLIAACVSSSYELILLCLVEFTLQFSVMYNISKDPTSITTPLLKNVKDKSGDKSSPTCPSDRYKTECEGSNPGRKARKVIAVQTSADIENPRSHAMSLPNNTAISKSSSLSPRVGTTDAKSIISGEVTSSEKSPRSFEPTSTLLDRNGNSNDDTNSNCHEDTGRAAIQPTPVKNSGSPRTPTDDAEEARLATWLGFTWLTGSLTPLAFLMCATFLCIGPNRGLFSPKVEQWRAVGGPVYSKLSAIETAAGLTRVWSLSIFNRDASDLPNHMWSIPTSTSDSDVTSSQTSHLVVRLLCVSFIHTAFLAAGTVWFWRNGDRENGKLFSKSLSGRISQLTHALDNPSNNCRASKDLLALISALLIYQFNVLSLTILMTMAVVFSVLFPWYGMNSAF